jgi:tRNA A37 threonylcarbamoyladenosine dehydratase
MTETWNERTLLLLGEGAVDRLVRAHVLVIGLGGVGAWVAENLCRAGVGRLTIADGDTIHASNRNRQLIALNSTEGLPKAEVVAARLKDINPDLEVEVIGRYLKDESLRSLVERPYDYVVDAIDTLSPKLFLLTHAVRYGHRVVSSMGAGGKLDPSKVMIADISKTHTCPLAWILRKRLHKQGIFTGIKAVFSPELVPEAAVKHIDNEPNKKTTVGTIAYMPPVFGCYIASVVLRDLLSDVAASDLPEDEGSDKTLANS